jgi:hypothetical protein
MSEQGLVDGKGKRRDKRWGRHLSLVHMFARREWRSSVAASYMHIDSALTLNQSAANGPLGKIS